MKLSQTWFLLHSSVVMLLLTVQPASSQVNYWRRVFGRTVGEVSAFAFSPSGSIFAGTFHCRGVYRSTNGGTTWRHVGLPRSGIYSMVCGSGYVFAGKEYYWGSVDSGGVSRSTDDGSTWQQTALINRDIRDLAVDSLGRLFAAAWQTGLFISSDNGLSWVLSNSGLTNNYPMALAIDQFGVTYVGTAWGLFRSTNSGTSWQLRGLSGYAVNSLSISSSGYLFAGANYSGVFRSSDGGSSWTQVYTATWPDGPNSLATGEGNLVLVSLGGRVIRSTDNGSTWQEALTGSPICVRIRPTDGDVFVGDFYGGIFRSTDNGVTWTQQNEAISMLNVLSLAANNGQFVFAGTLANGLYRTEDRGEQFWGQSGLTERDVSSLVVSNNGNLFAATGDGVARSTSNGSSWVLLTVGLPGHNVECISADSSGGMLAGGFGVGVYRSTDNGESWFAANTGLSNSDVLALATSQNGYLLTGTSAGVYRSTDGGAGWNYSSTGIDNRGVYCFVVKPNVGIFAGTHEGIFRSSDGGGNWDMVNSGLSNVHINALAVNPAGAILGGTRGGVFRSTDNGSTWAELNSGLTTTDVRSLVNDPGGYTYAGTYGGGVFRSIQPTTAVTETDGELPVKVVLFQNYPNPFNPATSIKYILPKSAHVLLRVFDVLGQHVSTLVDEVEGPGTKTVQFIPSQLSSGVYLYRLQAGTYAAARTMLLLR